VLIIGKAATIENALAAQKIQTLATEVVDA